MKNWEDYQIILAVFQSKTIRGAAITLGVSHSTVSRRLAQLENQVGSQLFEKTAHGYTPTSKCDLLIKHASQIEKIVYQSKRQLSALPQTLTGSLTLSVPDAIGQYLLLDELVAFSRQYPLIDVKIISSYSLVNLDENEADVAVRGTNQPSDHLVGHRLFPYCLGLYANRTYFSQTKRSDMRWITPNMKPVYLERIKQSAYSDIKTGLQISDVTMRHMAILKGHGIGRSPCYMAESEPLLMRLPNSNITPMADLWVLTHPDLRNNEKVKALMAFLCETLRAKKSLIMGQ